MVAAERWRPAHALRAERGRGERGVEHRERAGGGDHAGGAERDAGHVLRARAGGECDWRQPGERRGDHRRSVGDVEETGFRFHWDRPENETRFRSFLLYRDDTPSSPSLAAMSSADV